jgi:hypothetical protein
VRLFSAPGSVLSRIRAWLMTTPFDLGLSQPAVVTASPIDLPFTLADCGGASFTLTDSGAGAFDLTG